MEIDENPFTEYPTLSALDDYIHKHLRHLMYETINLAWRAIRFSDMCSIVSIHLTDPQSNDMSQNGPTYEAFIAQFFSGQQYDDIYDDFKFIMEEFPLHIYQSPFRDGAIMMARRVLMELEML